MIILISILSILYPCSCHYIIDYNCITIQIVPLIEFVHSTLGHSRWRILHSLPPEAQTRDCVHIAWLPPTVIYKSQANYFLRVTPTKWHFIWHIFWDSIWHPFWHKYRHSSWNLICILSGRRAAKLAWSRLCWCLIHGGIWTILEFRWRVVMLNKIEQSPLKLDLDFLFLIFWIILALVLLVSTFCSIEI